MAHSPIIVKDSIGIVKNPRQDLFDSEIDKIRGGKGIVLKGFKTEKMRIEEHLRNINFYYPNEDKKHDISKIDDLNSSTNKTVIKQPEMRFKPRTDLERIFDEINKNSVRSLDKHIIEKQFKTRENIITKKNHDAEIEEIPDYKDAPKEDEVNFNLDPLGIDKELQEKMKAETEKKMKLIKSRKKELNCQAKNIMKEFHNKTHFKGVSSIINFKSQTCKKNFKKMKKFKFTLKLTFYKNLIYNIFLISFS